MMSRLPVSRAVGIAAIVVAVGCQRNPRVAPTPPGTPPQGRGTRGVAFDPLRVYRDLGFIAATEGFPFIGSISYLAAAAPDSTLALVTLSFSNRGLTFTHEGDRYRGGYEVRLDIRQAGATPRRTEGHEIVRVASFRETVRSDESIIYQQYVSLAPGEYSVTVAVRDEGSAKAGGQEVRIQVPRLAAGSLSRPLPVYEARGRTSLDSIPDLAPSPRATAVFGTDSVVTVYVEGYGAASGRLPVRAVVTTDKGATLWTDSVALPRRGALNDGTITIPVSSIGVGVNTLLLVRGDTRDSVRAPIFVSFGEELPVASFEEMLDYLRYFTTYERLKALRDTAPEFRGRAWADFLRQTDPIPETPQHEGLHEYFVRVQVANDRFREEGMPGWMTDRGMVFIVLGEPDQVFEQGATESTHLRKTVVWDYRQHRLTLTFTDQTGFGRFKLTPRSEQDFRFIARQLQSR